MYAFRSYLNLGILDRFCHHLNTPGQIMRNWEPLKTNIEKFNNHRMIQLLTFRARQIIPATSVQDHDPRPFADNDHTSVLWYEMTTIEPDENPTRTLTWTSLVFLNHIKRRTIDDRFPLPIMGDFFLLKPWCSNPGPDWTCLTVCIQHFSVRLFISWVYYSVLWVTK